MNGARQTKMRTQNVETQNTAAEAVFNFFTSMLAHRVGSFTNERYTYNKKKILMPRDEVPTKKNTPQQSERRRRQKNDDEWQIETKI